MGVAHTGQQRRQLSQRLPEWMWIWSALAWPGRISFSLHVMLLSPSLVLLFVQHMFAICNVPTCVCVCVCVYTLGKNPVV